MFSFHLSKTSWKLWVLNQITICRSYKIIGNNHYGYLCRKTGLKIYSEKTWKSLLGIWSTQFSVVWIENVYLKGRCPRGFFYFCSLATQNCYLPLCWKWDFDSRLAFMCWLKWSNPAFWKRPGKQSSLSPAAIVFV